MKTKIKFMAVGFLLAMLLVGKSMNSYNVGAWFSGGRLHSYNFQTAHRATSLGDNGYYDTGLGCEGLVKSSNYRPVTEYYWIKIDAYAEKCSSYYGRNN